MAETARRLAAILAADVAGYSRLAGADEERTLARLRALRGDLFDPAIAAHYGRMVKRAGDGTIVEFRSVIDAARCALEVQTGMVERNAGVAPERQILFRIGIHIGDVVGEADGDLMGDGVNIAARLEGIAEPGGICLSEDAYRQVRDKMPETFADLGEKELKNIARPMRVYSISLQNNFTAPAKAGAHRPDTSTGSNMDPDFRRGGDKREETGRPTLALPDKPSIAVLPFQNMSGDPEQEYFADGMVEDIITGLSRIKWVFVIARNSSFVYKGNAVDIKQVGRELGVRYVLEGSVRKAGGRVRITGQLVEAETGAHLWADKFDGALDDVFDLQDRITASVVGVVEPSLRQAEIERAKRKPSDNLDAYDLYLRALPHMYSVVPEDARNAVGFLRDALARDPNYASAHALLAWCHEIFFVGAGFDEADRVAGVRHARAVIASSTDDATALAIVAFVIFHLDHDRQTALSVIDRALSLNDSSATALIVGARLHAFSGNPGVAIDLANRGLRLSPFDPFRFQAHAALGVAAYQEGRYDDAASNFAKAVQANPRFGSTYAAHAIALRFAGHWEEAKSVLQRLKEVDPDFRFRIFREMGIVPAIVDKFGDVARQLGLPE